MLAKLKQLFKKEKPPVDSSLDYGNLNIETAKQLGYAESDLGRLAKENSELRQYIDQMTVKKAS